MCQDNSYLPATSCALLRICFLPGISASLQLGFPSGLFPSSWFLRSKLTESVWSWGKALRMQRTSSMQGMWEKTSLTRTTRRWQSGCRERARSPERMQKMFAPRPGTAFVQRGVRCACAEAPRTLSWSYTNSRAFSLACPARQLDSKAKLTNCQRRFLLCMLYAHIKLQH